MTWLVVTGTWILYDFMTFPSYWEWKIIPTYPNWRTPSFFWGVAQPPTSLGYFPRSAPSFHRWHGRWHRVPFQGELHRGDQSRLWRGLPLRSSLSQRRSVTAWGTLKHDIAAGMQPNNERHIICVYINIFMQNYIRIYDKWIQVISCGWFRDVSRVLHWIFPCRWIAHYLWG